MRTNTDRAEALGPFVGKQVRVAMEPHDEVVGRAVAVAREVGRGYGTYVLVVHTDEGGVLALHMSVLKQIEEIT